MQKNKIFNIIQEDIEAIDRQLGHSNGSQSLWNSLHTKYTILLPDIAKHVKEGGGKICTVGLEYNYRPELKN